jgi:hypothetical protein
MGCLTVRGRPLNLRAYDDRADAIMRAVLTADGVPDENARIRRRFVFPVDDDTDDMSGALGWDFGGVVAPGGTPGDFDTAFGGYSDRSYIRAPLDNSFTIVSNALQLGSPKLTRQPRTVAIFSPDTFNLGNFGAKLAQTASGFQPGIFIQAAFNAAGLMTRGYIAYAPDEFSVELHSVTNGVLTFIDSSGPVGIFGGQVLAFDFSGSIGDRSVLIDGTPVISNVDLTYTTPGLVGFCGVSNAGGEKFTTMETAGMT